MTGGRVAAAAVLALAVGAGTIADRPPRNPPLTIGGYRVLAVDFHTHSSMWSDGALTPWGLVLEADRQGLDAIAITGHNEVIDGQVGRWFSRLVGGPTILAGEEILSDPNYHLIAASIRTSVHFRQRAADAIDEVHRQGGLAIAAHPLSAWVGYDADAMARLDGAEICHPLVFARDGAQRELERFFARAPLAAIGSSDFHGFGRMGLCRTYVFTRATDASSGSDEDIARAIVDAVRARRTVVYGRDGQAYGDRALIGLANDARVREREPSRSRRGMLDWISSLAGVLGLTGMLVFGRPRPITSAATRTSA